MHDSYFATVELAMEDNVPVAEGNHPVGLWLVFPDNAE